ncbi:hypothetical protein ACRC7T_08175 [Segnochrobactraceae bacterium EtOH-i3]
MISVGEGLGSLERASRALRAEEDRFTGMAEMAVAEIARLRTAQAELFRTLARIRLDELGRENVLAPLNVAEQEALASLKARQDRLAAIAGDRQTLLDGLRHTQAERDSAAAALEAARSAQADLEARVHDRLAEEVGWQAQAARVAGAEGRAEAADRKATQAEADRDEKSKPYLADRLFVYLWQRKWGTSAYRGGPLARLGDGYVARVIAYEPARQNYFRLTEIPVRLREHASRLAEEVETERAALAALERAALEADGIVAAEAACTRASDAVARVDDTLANVEARIATLDRERATLLEDDGGTLERLSASMQQQNLRDLLREALATPTPEDERVVEQLQTLNDAVARQEKTAADARTALAGLARKRAEIERSRAEFRRYEGQGGGFSNEKLIGDVLGGIIGGVLSSRELQDALRSGHRPGPGGRSGGSSPGRSSGGGFRTGGSMGGSSGGGFRTGGSF